MEACLPARYHKVGNSKQKDDADMKATPYFN